MKKNKMLLVAAAAALLVSCGDKGAMTGDNSYPVQTVSPQSATLQSTYPAVIRGIQDVEIRPKVSGFITKVCVKEGQAVKAGQLLFVIDNVTYEAAVRQAQAAVNTASASLNTAKLTYENSKKLFANKVIGSYELQSAQNSFESAQAQRRIKPFCARQPLHRADKNVPFARYLPCADFGVCCGQPVKFAASDLAAVCFVKFDSPLRLLRFFGR